jgi:hypothetical protein
MPKVIDFTPAPPGGKVAKKQCQPEINGKQSKKPIKTRTVTIDGVKYKVIVLPPEPEAAMMDSRFIWGDGPKKKPTLALNHKI